MTQTKSVFMIIIMISLLQNSMNAQSYWASANDFISTEQQSLHIQQYNIFQLDTEVWQKALQEATFQKKTSTKIILPFPISETEFISFEIEEVQMMEAGLAAKYPRIKTYRGQSLDGQHSVRFDWTSTGLHAYIYTLEGEYLINPLTEKSGFYLLYDTKEAVTPQGIKCGTNVSKEEDFLPTKSELKTGDELRVMRMAVATTGEFARQGVANSDTPLEAVVTLVNRLNAITERDLALQFILVENNDLITFTDAATDPYEENDAYELLGDNTSVLNEFIGQSNYDIGHVFTADISGGVAGVAILGSVCRASKARGVTAFFGNDANFLNTFAHEVGHQLGASHTWNRCGEDSNDQRSTRSAVEPGSGSTIMSYAGSCGADNVSTSASNFFHSFNTMQMNDLLADLDCYETVSSENTPPDVRIPYSEDLYVPMNTPFELTAIGSDPDGDRLTYSWEQSDLGPATSPEAPEANSPSFRAFPPRSSPTRILPSFFSQILNTPARSEILPTYERRLSFTVIVRDNNRPAGGTAQERFSFRVTPNADSFAITYPNERNVEFEAGSILEVTWNVNGTDSLPVNCQTVDIMLSYSNGNDDFPDTLAQDVPNNGRAFVVLPEELTNRARLKIKASDNIFFDYNNERFRIVEKLVGTNPTLAIDDIDIYPNPTNGQLFIRHQLPFATAIEWSLWNVQGQRVQQGSQLLTNNDELNIAQQPSGIYFLQIVHEKGTITKKIRLE